MKKTCKVILISTEYKGGLAIGRGKLRQVHKKAGAGRLHLFMISDETPEVGDWYLVEPFGKNTGYIPQSLARLEAGEEKDAVDYGAKKIVATTAPLIRCACELGHPHDDSDCMMRIPQDFIDTYVERHNTPQQIDEVKLTFNKRYIDQSYKLPDIVHEEVAIDEDGFIEITLMDGTYTEEQVIELFSELQYDMAQNVIRGGDPIVPLEWFGEKLGRNLLTRKLKKKKK